jgi:hypothetical protein
MARKRPIEQLLDDDDGDDLPVVFRRHRQTSLADQLPSLIIFSFLGLILGLVLTIAGICLHRLDILISDDVSSLESRLSFLLHWYSSWYIYGSLFGAATMAFVWALTYRRRNLSSIF